MSVRATPIILRVAAVWGTTVLVLRGLEGGESFEVSDRRSADLPKPDGNPMPDLPVRAVGAGWELDARGATGGWVQLRGRPEDPAALGRAGAPIPVVAGDLGLVQFGTIGVFFQFTPASPRLGGRVRVDWAFVLALLLSCVLVGGGLWLLASITTPRALPKPVELSSPEEIVAKYMLGAEPERPPPAAGAPDSASKDAAKASLGRRASRAQGRLGLRGREDEARAEGRPADALGSMSDVLSSEVGAEIQRTLGSIGSVAEALGGLDSSSLVLGSGSGLGFRGSASGGGGEAAGVPFGAGPLDTSAAGGIAASGAGRGGGHGEASGSSEGVGERKVTGAQASRVGQGLSPEQIQRVVMSRYGAFRACYESAAAHDPALHGGVTIAWSIAPGGSVIDATVAQSSLGSPRAEGCILRQFRRLRFPAADKPTNASFPLLFRPGK